RCLFMKTVLPLAMILGISLFVSGTSAAQDQDGMALFQQHCAFCHTGAEDSRAPGPEVLLGYSPEAVIRALTDGGSMRTQGYLLSGEQRRAIAEHVTGKTLRSAPLLNDIGQCRNH